MLVESPLLSYIDVWHANFLPSSLTIGEARDLGPHYTTAEDHALVRDESAERMSQCRKVHVPVKESEALAQPTKLKAAEAHQDAELVTRRKMTVDCFLLGTRLTT